MRGCVAFSANNAYLCDYFGEREVKVIEAVPIDIPLDKLNELNNEADKYTFGDRKAFNQWIELSEYRKRNQNDGDNRSNRRENGADDSVVSKEVQEWRDAFAGGSNEQVLATEKTDVKSKQVFGKTTIPSTPKTKAEIKAASQLVQHLKNVLGNALVVDKKEMQKVLGNEEAETADGTQFLKTKDGEVYEFVKGGKMYLDPDLLNMNTPIHEYNHLWDNALMATNPELWNKWKELAKKKKSLWDEVVNDEGYADIADDEDLVASEIKSRLVGDDGEALLQRLADEAMQKEDVLERAEGLSFIEQLKQTLKDMWEATKQWLKNANFFSDKVAQICIERTEDIEFVEVAELRTTERGTGGYGSTD